MARSKWRVDEGCGGCPSPRASSDSGCGLQGVVEGVSGREAWLEARLHDGDESSGVEGADDGELSEGDGGQELSRHGGRIIRTPRTFLTSSSHHTFQRTNHSLQRRRVHVAAEDLQQVAGIPEPNITSE